MCLRRVCSVSGVGCDAKVALEIHNLREENPEKFYNQVFGLPYLSLSDLHKKVEFEKMFVSCWSNKNDTYCILFFPLSCNLLCWESGI